MTVLARQYRFAVLPTGLSIAASGLAAAGTLLVARQVGAGQFGGYTLVVVLGGILVVAATLNLNVVLYQELPRRPAVEHDALVSTALAATLVGGGGVGLLVALAAPAVQAVTGVDAGTVRWSALFAVTTGLAALAEGALRGRARYRRAAGLRLAAAAAYVAASAWGLFVLDRNGFGTYVALLSTVNVMFAVLALADQPVRRRLVSWALARRLAGHGGLVSLTTLVALLVFGVDVVVLNHVGTATDVGRYAIYNGFPKRLLGILFTEGVGLVLLPALAPLPKPALLRRLVRIAPGLGLAAAAVTYVAGALVLAVLGPDYPSSPGLLALAAVGIGVHTVFNLFYLTLTVDGPRGARVALRCLLGGLPFCLLVQVLLIARWGLDGALAAFVVTNALLLAVILVVTARVYRPEGTT